MTDSISSASPPPPYDFPSDGKAKSAMFPVASQRCAQLVQLPQQPQNSLSMSSQKCDFSSTAQSPVEPIIMPIVMPQPAVIPYPCQQPMSDKPVNIVVNANSKAEENSSARDYRICNVCKRGIMKKKKDWFRVIAILLISMLCPPLSFLCCFFLCTSTVYFGECSACHRISKKEHKVF